MKWLFILDGQGIIVYIGGFGLRGSNEACPESTRETSERSQKIPFQLTST